MDSAFKNRNETSFQNNNKANNNEVNKVPAIPPKLLGTSLANGMEMDNGSIGLWLS